MKTTKALLSVIAFVAAFSAVRYSGWFAAAAGVPADLRDAVGEPGAMGDLVGLSSGRGDGAAASAPAPVPVVEPVAGYAAKDMEAELFGDAVFQAIASEKERVESAMKACDLSESNISDERHVPLSNLYIAAAARMAAWADATKFRLVAGVGASDAEEIYSVVAENDRVVSYIEKKTKRVFPASSVRQLSPEMVGEWLKKLQVVHGLSDDAGKERIGSTLRSVKFQLFHKFFRKR